MSRPIPVTIKDKIYASKSAETLIQVLEGEWNNLNAEDLACIFSQLGGILFRAKQVKSPKGRRYLESQKDIQTIEALSHSQNRHFLQAIIQKFTQFIPHMTTQSLTLSARAIATLDFFPKELLGIIADQCVKIQFKQYIPKNLSNLIQAFDIRKQFHPQLFSAVAKLLIDTQFKGFELSEMLDLMANIAKSQYNDPALSQAFFKSVLMFDLKELDEKTLCQLIWTLAKIEIDKVAGVHYQPLLEKLSELALQHGQEHGHGHTYGQGQKQEQGQGQGIYKFRPYNISRLAWGLGKLGFCHKKLFEEIANYTIANIIPTNYFTTSEIMNIFWAYGKLNLKHPKLITAVCNHVFKSRLKGFNEQDISNLVYTLALLKIKDTDLLKEISLYAETKVHTFRSQAVANIAWSLATLAEDPKDLKEYVKMKEFNDLLTRLAERAKQVQLAHYSAQEVMNLAWAFVTVNKREAKDEHLFQSIAKRCLSMQFEGFTSQHVSIIAWCFARLNLKHGLLMKGLSAKFQTFNPREIEPIHYSNMAWAFQFFAIKDSSLRDSINNQVRKADLTQFGSQSLSIIGHFEASMSNQNKDFLSILANNMLCSNNFNQAKPEHLTKLMWSLAHAGIYHKVYIETTSEKLLTMDFNSFDTQDISGLVYALVKFKMQKSPLLKKLIDHLLQRTLDINYIHHVTEILWGFAILNVNQPKLFQKILDFIAQHLKEFEEDQGANYDNHDQDNLTMHVHQIYQFKTYCEVNRIPLSWPKQLSDVMTHYMKFYETDVPRSTNDHQRVIHSLTRLLGQRKDIELKNEHFEAGFFIDSALLFKSINKGDKDDNNEKDNKNDRDNKSDKIVRKVAIEVFGNVHFDWTGDLKSEDLFKRHLLIALHWECETILNETIRSKSDEGLDAYLLTKFPFLSAPEGTLVNTVSAPLLFRSPLLQTPLLHTPKEDTKTKEDAKQETKKDSKKDTKEETPPPAATPVSKPKKICSFRVPASERWVRTKDPFLNYQQPLCDKPIITVPPHSKKK